MGTFLRINYLVTFGIFCCGFTLIVDGNWTDWGSWGSCSVTCDTGTQTRTRTCDNSSTAAAGVNCSGDAAESQSCIDVAICPVDGSWADWTTWADCSVTCGYGIWNRTRTCTNPAPKGTGAYCTGDTIESISCYPLICPVDGMWGDWTIWGACSVTCATGTQTRTRKCDNPAKAGAGSDCAGDSSERRSCFISDVCPVYNTGTLSENSQLSISCPGNLSYYVYIVEGYYGNPQYGSTPYKCQSAGATDAFTRACHGNSECSVTINDATFGGDPCAYTTTTYSRSYYTQQFSKVCSQTSFGYTTYYQCYESRTLSRQDAQVNQHTRTKYGYVRYQCARDGVWSGWSTWTGCTCNGGSKERKRTCSNPEKYAPGRDCPGNSFETTHCYPLACPANYYSPVITDHAQADDMFFKTGDVITLPCVASGFSIGYDWTKNDVNLNPNNNYMYDKTGNGTLVITTTAASEGAYQCSASNKFGKALTNPVHLNKAYLYFPPSGDTKLTVSLNQSVVMHCNHTSYPEADVDWYFTPFGSQGKSRVQLNSRVTTDFQGNLYITYLKQEDTGIYRCKIKNLVKPQGLEGPKIELHSDGSSDGETQAELLWTSDTNKVGVFGEKVHLKCIIGGILPSISVVWTISLSNPPGCKAIPNHTGQEKTIQSANYCDAGDYTCTAGGVNQTITLTIESEPIWTEKPMNWMENAGSTANFRCNAQGTPNPTCTWLINGQSVNDSDHSVISTTRFSYSSNLLQITDVRSSDMMVVQCLCENSHGHLYANAFLHVKDTNQATTTTAATAPVPMRNNDDSVDPLVVIVPVVGAVVIVVVISVACVLYRNSKTRDKEVAKRMDFHGQDNFVYNKEKASEVRPYDSLSPTARNTYDKLMPNEKVEYLELIDDNTPIPSPEDTEAPRYTDIHSISRGLSVKSTTSGVYATIDNL